MRALWLVGGGVMLGWASACASRGYWGLMVGYLIAAVFFLLASRCFPADAVEDSTEQWKRAKANLRRAK